MERVTGIGGLFFRGNDPALLADWYETHLGVIGVGESYDDPVWLQQEGPTVFAAFGPDHWDSPHLGPTGWGVNFRVADLDAMVAQLHAAGIDVAVDDTLYPNGRFAQLADPEGNPIQLWQPT